MEIAAGELVDKITILEIKKCRITEAAKLKNVRAELEALQAVRARVLPASQKLDQLADQLKEINETLWFIEDRIRDHEREQNFGAAFVELARMVYVTNDRRAAVKSRINQLAGSRLVEEKSYAAYAPTEEPRTR